MGATLFLTRLGIKFGTSAACAPPFIFSVDDVILTIAENRLELTMQ